MSPHPRQPTPPRRDNGSPGGGEGAHEEGVAPEEQYVPDESIAYDPGAALADDNQGYAQAGYEYADPNQEYVDPNAIYDETQYTYADPNQGYVDPNAIYDETQYTYADPNQGYADPNAIYDENTQAYVDPGQIYIDPATGYEVAGHEYVDPNQQAGYPEPGYATGGVYDDAPEPAYQAPPPPPPRPVKKKVTSRAPQQRLATPPRKIPGGGYRRPAPTYNTGGGFSFMTVLLTLVALAMLGAVAMVVLPRDMTTVAAYPVNPLTATGKPRNLLEEAQKMMVTRTADLSFTEEEVNQYLNHRLQAEQTGPMAALVKFRGVYIDFTPGFADVIIERELFGMPLTMSATITTEKFRQQTIYRASNWHLGRVDLGKRTIKPVIDLFLRLRMSCLDEFQTLQQMVDVKFEDNKVFLDATL
jgi:hypothetical protein